MADKQILCAIGVDLDAVGGWLGSYGGEDSPDDISRGLFAGEVGTPRLLKLFERLNIKTSWFIPGHSIETFPEECRMIVEQGHEVGMHGYSPREPHLHVPGAGGDGAPALHRPDHRGFGQAAPGLRRAVVGV